MDKYSITWNITMSNMKKLLDIMNEMATTSGAVATVATPLGSTQRRDASVYSEQKSDDCNVCNCDPCKCKDTNDSDGTRAPDAPKAKEFGLWKNSVLAGAEQRNKKKSVKESHRDLSSGCGFSIRSDILWPAYLIETKQPEKYNEFVNWLNKVRESQSLPQKSSKCILAMINLLPDSINVFYGPASYVDQTDTQYILKISSGTHEYSKKNQIIFDNNKSFDKFMTLLSLKFADSDISIEKKQMSVMEGDNKITAKDAGGYTEFKGIDRAILQNLKSNTRKHPSNEKPKPKVNELEYGSGQRQLKLAEENISEEQLLAKQLARRLELFMKGLDKELGKKALDREIISKCDSIKENSEKDSLWKQGWNGWFDREYNPYEKGTTEYSEWQNGFEDAEAQPDFYNESADNIKKKVSESDAEWAKSMELKKRNSLHNSLKKKDRDTIDKVRSMMAKEKNLKKTLDEMTDDIPDLEEVGEPILSIMDAERRLSSGDRIFAFHEMDEEPFEIFNVQDLEGYTYDQLLAVSTDDTDRVDEISKQTLGSYVKKANDQSRYDANRSGFVAGKSATGYNDTEETKLEKKRSSGIAKAIDRLTKESVQSDVSKDSFNEINYASELGSLSLSDEEIIKNSRVAGTIGSRKIFVFEQGSDTIYFFVDNKKLDALLYLSGDRLLAMKNFSKNSGLIYNLFQFVVNIKNKKIKLSSVDKLTLDGLKWLINQSKRPNGFKITDQRGNDIDSDRLSDEWEQSRITGKSGSTSIVIGESKFSKHLINNESRLIPMDIFGSTIKESTDITVPQLLQNKKIRTPVMLNYVNESSNYSDSMTDSEWEREYQREKLEKELARKEIEKNHVSQFKTKEEAIEYANDKLKTFKDSKIGMSVYAMPDGGFDVSSTARTAATEKRRKLISDAGGKHLGTLGPRFTKHKMAEQDVAEGAQYNSQYKSKELAIEYAKEKVKSFRDPEDGIEIWSMPDGGFDVVHTMNSNGRNHCMKNGGKKLGTVGKRYKGVAEAENFNDERFPNHSVKKLTPYTPEQIARYNRQAEKTGDLDYNPQHMFKGSVGDIMMLLNKGNLIPVQVTDLDQRNHTVVGVTTLDGEKKVYGLDWIDDKNRVRLRPMTSEEQAQYSNKQQGVAEATGDLQFDKMMKKVTKAPTAKERNAERIRQKRERQEDSRKRSADAFGTSPADKLGIRNKGVAEDIPAHNSRGLNNYIVVYSDENSKRKEAKVRARSPNHAWQSFENAHPNYRIGGIKDDNQGVAEGMSGLSAKEKGKIQYVTAQISVIPGNWDQKNKTYTAQGLKDLKSVMKNEKYLKYALSLTADDYEAEGVSEGNDPWKQKHFGPTKVMQKVFRVKTDDKAFNVRAETEQQAREILEKHAPDSNIVSVKFVRNVMSEETMTQAANNSTGPKFGGYYGATQKGAPKKGQGFGASESIESKNEESPEEQLTKKLDRARERMSAFTDQAPLRDKVKTRGEIRDLTNKLKRKNNVS